LWSTVWLAIKIGVSVTPPLTVAWVRLAIALAVLAPIAAAQGRLRLGSNRDVVILAASGFLLLGLNYACVFWGSQYLPSGLVAVIQAVTPLAALLFAASLGIEHITRAKTLSLIVGAAGVAVICASQFSRPQADRAILAFGAVLVSVLCVAGAYVLIKRSGHSLHPTTVITWQMFAGLLPLAIAALLIEGDPLSVPWTRGAVIATVYLALAGSVCAFWLNYWLLQRMPASALLLMSVVEPPIAALLGRLFLGERLGGWIWTGTALVLLGTAGVMRATRVTATPGA
jgi:drug/metabolite transporter (DMT)-like permease